MAKLSCGLTFSGCRIRHSEIEASNGEGNGEQNNCNSNTRSLRERNENSSSQSSDNRTSHRKVASKSKGSENAATAKRKLDTYDIGDIIDSEV